MSHYICGRCVCDLDTDTVTRSVTGLALSAVRHIHLSLGQSNYFHHSKFRDHSC